ncbi:3-carboxyethylcatechol 2,3-dioxygenase [Corynebacterium poyangense]|uniref:3-carboxyethylcatechol 2,3-dioxygenase n=1 Tax=Corynebacterium poyangense TaxID=2684405 RepID=A0A7H0SM59_9CORY|nr:3-carboxyethylcatechol 2,3-dioxygenase [Corynebacterium poyangense]MBZ8176730.1 3-carboxyethylcatechol 2,3-dioxygenase [Corynebacterium poyangense]QNQ89634.1 3-carboxyethylcatechol 2,3-dioxygenase [Corynebacterium poyangense]
MSVALLAMSHSPLLHHNPPAPDVQQGLDEAMAKAKQFVHDFDPDLVVVFWPDHFNGFFYELMPQFCIGYQAFGTGDYNSFDQDLTIPEQLSEELAQFVLDHDVDVAISRRMEVDHGAVQALEMLYDGAVGAKPVIPIYINGVARPFAPTRRIRQLGQAVGEFFKTTDKKVLFISSGGLSHDPPLPRWDEATPEQRALLLSREARTSETRAAREARVIETGKKFAAGEADIMDINPEWDRQFMADCRSGNPERFDQYYFADMDAQAGHSSHEVRTWMAGFSALHAVNPSYTVDFEYYEPIPEFIAGFGIMTAR